MKNVSELKEKKAYPVRVNKALNKYDNVVLFPNKVKKAKETLEKLGIPNQIKKSR